MFSTKCIHLPNLQLCLQDAGGELTEANFGNDDETLGRLEDMGVAASGLVGNDVTRQNQVCVVPHAWPGV